MAALHTMVSMLTRVGLVMMLLLCSAAAFSQTPDFTISKKQGCIPLSGVNFTDISTGGTVTRRDWNLGNGTIINNGAATVGTNYLTDGTFTVTLTVTFSNGDVKTKTDYITVHPKPIADFSANETEGCAPHAVQFTSLASTKTGTLTNWLWDFGAGGSNQPNPAFTYNANGNYNISLIVTNSWGCESEAAVKLQYIKVYAKVNASFNIPVASSCDTPFVASFVNTTTGGGTITYEWDFGDGQTSTDPNPTHTYINTGAYTVKLTAKNGSNCTSTYIRSGSNGIFAGKPTATATGQLNVCANTAANFSGGVTPAAFLYSVKWLFPDNGAVQYGQNTSHVFTTPGTYDITMVAYNYAGCHDTAHHTITVKPGPNPDFTADRTIGCDTPFVVQFTNTTIPVTDLTYDWNFGDGSTHATTLDPSHTYHLPGYYTVTLTVTDTITGCVNSIQYPSMIRIVKPIVDFTYTPHEGCRPLPVKATARLSNMIDPVASYIWDFGDGTIVTTVVDNATHTYTVAGSYNIRLKIITQQGCSDSSILKPVAIANLCDDDGSGGGGGGGGGGFTLGKDCSDKYTILFTDTVTNSKTLSWDFGDGTPLYTTPPLNPVTHTFPTTFKKYIVTINRIDTVTNTPSSGQIRAIIIDEKANFIPSITDICRNKTVNVNTIGIDSSNISKYTWDFGDSTARVIINNKSNYQNYGIYLNGNASHIYADTGTFYIKLIIEDKIGCLDSFQYAIPIRVKGPQVGFSGNPLTTCDPKITTIFTDTSAQNGNTPIVEWTWNFGDGTPAYTTTQDTAISHTYSGGSYYNAWNVSLNIKDAIGCEAQVIKNSYVKTYQPKAAFFSYDTLKCGSLNVFLYNYSGAYNASYTWDFGDGTTATSTNASHTYTTNGQYDIKLVVKDENGCMDSVTTPAYIKLVKPKADFTTGDTSKCAPIAINFYDSSAYSNSYVWDFGDGGTGSTDKNPAAHIYAVPGFYPVKLKIVGVSGCIDSTTKVIRVKGPIGQLSVGPVTGCTPYTLSMKVTGSSISSYAWDYGDGTPVQASMDDVVNHVYPLAGKFLPNVILTSPEGCPFTLKAKDTVVVDSARALFSIDRPLRCFTDRTIQFTNLSATAFGVQSYKWLFGDNQTSNTESPSHTYTTDGEYDVALIVESKIGCIDTLTLPKAISIRQQPIALFQADSTYCSPGIKTFNSRVQSVDAIDHLSWYLDGNFAGNATNLQFPVIAGTHIIALSATTVNGCVDSAAHRIITDSLVADYTINKAIRCGDDRTIPVNDLSYAFFGMATHIWDMGDNTALPDINPVHTYATPGSYNTSLIIISNTGCRDTFAVTQPVKIYTKPIPQINGLAEKCAENSITYMANVQSEDSISRYTWKLNNNIISNQDKLSHYFANAGNYDLSLTVNTKYGCEEIADTTITIRPLPVPAVTPKDTTVCIGSSVPLHAADGNQFVWTPQDYLRDPLTANPLAVPFRDTRYYVTVTNVFGCKQQDSMMLHIDNKVGLAHSDDAVICRGEQIKLTATGNTQNFAWIPATGLSDSHIATPVASPQFTTTYQVVGYSSNTCPNDTGAVTITVGDIPTVNLGADLTVEAGQPVDLKPVTSTDVIRYNWQPSTGLSCTTCSTPRFIADKDVAYTLKVQTKYGCEAVDDIRVTVVCGKGAVYIPNAFTPNNDGKNDRFNIKGYGIQKIKSLRVFNRWGQLVYLKENFSPGEANTGWDGTVNGKPGEAGGFVYIAEVVCNQGTPLTLKGMVMLVR